MERPANSTHGPTAAIESGDYERGFRRRSTVTPRSSCVEIDRWICSVSSTTNCSAASF